MKSILFAVCMAAACSAPLAADDPYAKQREENQRQAERQRDDARRQYERQADENKRQLERQQDEARHQAEKQAEDNKRQLEQQLDRQRR